MEGAREQVLIYTFTDVSAICTLIIVLIQSYQVNKRRNTYELLRQMLYASLYVGVVCCFHCFNKRCLNTALVFHHDTAGESYWPRQCEMADAEEELRVRVCEMGAHAQCNSRQGRRNVTLRRC